MVLRYSVMAVTSAGLDVIRRAHQIRAPPARAIRFAPEPSLAAYIRRIGLQQIKASSGNRAITSRVCWRAGSDGADADFIAQSHKSVSGLLQTAGKTMHHTGSR